MDTDVLLTELRGHERKYQILSPVVRQAADAIARLTTALERIASPVQHVEGAGVEHMIATIEKMREIAKGALEP